LADREIILKELDHIQVILGRFDTFFFLMKQVCLAGIAAVFAASVAGKLKIIPLLIFVIPIVFLLMEISFRFCYWTRYVDRIETIRRYIQGDGPCIRPYVIVEKRGMICDKPRWCRSVKIFDIIYYLTWAVVSLIAGLIFVLDLSILWHATAISDSEILTSRWSPG
jgi:hypothetical protein